MESKKIIYSAKADPAFARPVIDCREQRERETLSGEKLRYHYLHGYFEGTNVKFLFCFPEKGKYEGRFFQHLSPFPGPDEELAALDKRGEDDFLAFALTHGAAYVESNMGSSAVFGSERDNTIFYRSSAAVAEYCRTAAQELYGPHRVYGYVYGGSGGGYKTMSCIENTDAFNGAVPFVIGSPVSLPNCLTTLAHGMRLLRHCWPKIVDALEPGGSGNPYEGLNKEEADALREITRMGMPPRTLSDFAAGDDGSLPVLAPVVHAMDSTYFEDFWNVPGYLGADPQGSAVRERIYMRTKLVSVSQAAQGDSSALRKAVAAEKDGSAPGQMADAATGQAKEVDGGASEQTASSAAGPTDGRNGTDDAWQKMMADAGVLALEAEEVPEKEDLYLKGTDIVFLSGAAKGQRLRLQRIEGKYLIPGASYGAADPREMARQIRPGDEILLDNSDYLALQTYHRHQIPADPTFHAWDQFKAADGSPLYPQRPQVISYAFTAGGCGSVQDGQIQGKVIVINNLMDGDFPWQADWYRRKVESVLGEKAAQENFRLWYNDNAPHGDVSEGGNPLRVVSYLGMLRQALLDLAAWVEQGREPVPTSGYVLKESQVTLAEDPKERGGIQPMVKLLANGKDCARVRPGEKVHFTAELVMPEGAGVYESAAWSFEGETDFPYPQKSVEITEQGRKAVLSAEHVFSKPGVYFPVVRVVSNRNPEDGYTRLRNLCRVRVIIS